MINIRYTCIVINIQFITNQESKHSKRFEYSLTNVYSWVLQSQCMSKMLRLVHIYKVNLHKSTHQLSIMLGEQIANVHIPGVEGIYVHDVVFMYM